LISKPVGVQTKRLEGVFVKCMSVLVDVFTSSLSSSSSKRSSTKRKTVSLKKKTKKLLASSFPTHFERSLMPEIIHLYLSNTNVKDWITHSEMYTAILDLLRYMFEEGFGEGVMDVGLRRIERSCGLREWLLANNNKRGGEMMHMWVLVREEMERAKKEMERVRKGGMSRGLLRGGAEEREEGLVDSGSAAAVDVSSSTSSVTTTTTTTDKKEKNKKSEEVEVETEVKKVMVIREKGIAATMVPLKSLIMGLETQRTSLLEVLDKVTFMPTVVKLNMLCDGISQLVLGQVLGI
jgi:hypothetical protein